jgi:hypothetical protein
VQRVDKVPRTYPGSKQVSVDTVDAGAMSHANLISSTGAPTQANGDIRPASANDCLGVLASYGYGWTWPRLGACVAGQYGGVRGQGVCVSGLVATGVFWPIAFYACVAALS